MMAALATKYLRPMHFVRNVSDSMDFIVICLDSFPCCFEEEKNQTIRIIYNRLIFRRCYRARGDT